GGEWRVWFREIWEARRQSRFIVSKHFGETPKTIAAHSLFCNISQGAQVDRWDCWSTIRELTTSDKKHGTESTDENQAHGRRKGFRRRRCATRTARGAAYSVSIVSAHHAAAILDRVGGDVGGEGRAPAHARDAREEA